MKQFGSNPSCRRGNVVDLLSVSMHGIYQNFLVLPRVGPVTRSELIARLAVKNPALYHRDIERLVATILDEVGGALERGGRRARATGDYEAWTPGE